MVSATRTGRPAGHGESWQRLEGERAFIAERIEKQLRLIKIHELLARRGVVVPYRTLHRFAVSELGFGRARAYASVRPAAAAEFAVLAPGQTSAHSWPLHQAIGTGLLGVGALALLTAAAVRRAWTNTPEDESRGLAVGVVVVAAFLLQRAFNIASVGSDFLFWTGIGLAAIGPAGAGSEVDRPRGRKRRSLVLPTVALLTGLFLASTTGNWLEASHAVRRSDLLRASGELELAEREALLATQRDAGRANNWNVLGLARSPTAPSRALAAFERASALSPYGSRYLINVVKEEVRPGESDPARLEQARFHAFSRGRDRPAERRDPHGAVVRAAADR